MSGFPVPPSSFPLVISPHYLPVLYSSYARKMVNDGDISKAIIDLKSQSEPNIPAAAKKYGVVERTLRRRFKGETVSYAEAASIHHKLLSDAQEKDLVAYIQKQCERGLGISPWIIRNIVVEIVGHDIGLNWVTRFTHRHNDELVCLYMRNLDQVRNVADNSGHYNHYFKFVS